MSRRISLLNFLALALVSGTCYAVPVVHTADFITDSTRSGFNGFEDIPGSPNYTGGSGPYVEGGIEVRQVSGDAGNDIWTTFNPGGLEGLHGWYPNGGDLGYTSIRLVGGVDFDDVGFLVGSGFTDPVAMIYELWNDGSLVLTGSLAQQRGFRYFGFSGGGFDAIFLRDTNSSLAHTMQDNTLNALTVDSIEIRNNFRSVPEPATLGLLGLGLVGLGFARRRKTQA